MITKLRLVFAISILFFSFYGVAQSTYWQQETSRKSLNQAVLKRFDVKKGMFFSLNTSLFRKELKTISTSKSNSKTVYFPNEKGKLIPFQVSESSVFAPKLAAKYPSIKSYKGYALKNSKDKIYFSVSQNGFQGMIVYVDNKSSTFIQKIEANRYVFYSRDAKDVLDDNFTCVTKSVIAKQANTTQKPVDDQLLRTYKLAVSTSGEYTAFHGGTVVGALAAINATITRVNAVFETDFGLTLELIANNDQVVFTNASTDPYSGNLNMQVQNTLSSIIGEANYDVGHLFHVDNDNGNAGFIGAVCRDGIKGSGFTSALMPEGDRFDLDFVSHELGHQFGANHTWSFESEGTNVQVEPGSGTTIMGYAGITGLNNVALVGDDYFHYVSIVQVINYLKTTSCAVETNLINVPPVVVPTGDFVIPIGTPFVLTGEATDANVADELTYTWEQIDDGIVTQSSFGPTNPIGANFRSQPPSINPERYFPNLSSVVQGNLTQTFPGVNAAWETVSNVQRNMNFALTVRDNAIGGGQVVSDLVNVAVVNTAGPFVVTSQDTNVTVTAGSIETVVWDVAQTNIAPVNAQNVDIMLSTDGGLTFPISLAENVPNDGSHTILIPQEVTTEARIMVKAHSNIFYAVNSTDFTIEESSIVLNFDALQFEVCQPNDLMTNFIYETGLAFNEEVSFSVVSPPSGLTVSFSPTTAMANGTPVEISFSDTQNLVVGSYPIQVRATSTSTTKEVVINLNINNTTFTDISLASPVDDATDIFTETVLEWLPDINASSYDIQIATDSNFATIIDSGTVITNSYLPSTLENDTTYFWRVKPKNSCGEGTFGVAYSFTTIVYSCANKSASDLPIVISSSGTPTVVSRITFFEDISIADIDVNLNIEHAFLSDLVVSLTSPSGTTVILMSNSCNNLENVNATFDDSASSVFVCGGNPAISGRVRGIGALNAFNEESLLGEWLLTINDTAAVDGGSFISFSMDVCTEGTFRPDEDSDGVFDDGPDLCLGTPLGVEVDIDGCQVFRFSNDNFLFVLQSESCISNDGEISIDATQLLDYSITVSGNGTNVTDVFTDTYILSGLIAGNYTVCINGNDGTIVYEEQCFNNLVGRLDDLAVTSKIAFEEKTVSLELQGSNLYTIELNAKVQQIPASEIILNLKNGLNTLKVSTNLPCQGTYEEQILITDRPIVHPNPFTDSVNVYFGKNVEEVCIEVFSSLGKLVHGKKYQVNGIAIDIDLSTLPTGLYFIKFEGKNIKGASKLIKL